jgi:sugar lactone lactonase YvrE
VKRVTTLAALLMLSACTPSTSPSASASPSSSESPLPSCPASVAPVGPESVFAGQPGVDDLAFDSEGRLLVSNTSAGTLWRWTPGGPLEQIAHGLDGPEGIVQLWDGRVLVAEQGLDRVVVVDPAASRITTWRTFPNTTSNEGIDGLALDPHTGDVIVPDSPNGRVFRVSADGSRAEQIAAGLTRPVGAAVDARGRVLVADEGGALWVLGPPAHRLLSLPEPDDVVISADGTIFVNTLQDGAIHAIDPQGRHSTLLRGLGSPQGVALDGAGNLYYTESSAGRVGRLNRAFLLGTPSVKRLSGGRLQVCLALERAGGFSASLQLSIPQQAGVHVIRVRQPAPDSSGAVEVRLDGGTQHFTLTVSSTAGRLSQVVSAG